MTNINPFDDFLVTPKRVIYIDWSVYTHAAIFAWRIQKSSIPAAYYCINSIMTCLAAIKSNRDDTIIIAMDSYGKGDNAYKANRKEARDKQDDIDWGAQFNDMNKLLANLHKSTHFIPIQIDRLEADDIISYGCRHFTDKLNILLTTDSDMNQLYALGNVKIYSPKAKRYREVDNPLKELAKKIQKETTDNLITPVVTELDYQRRKTIVNLLELPDEIDALLKIVYDNLEPKTNYNPDNLKFPNIRKKYKALYGE